MPFHNFENRHFTADETNTILDTLTALEAALSSKLANLTPRERQQYGSIREHNKLFVKKVKEYNDNQPQDSSPDVNWKEFNNDYTSRDLLEAVIQRLQTLLIGTNNAKILHDWDVYKAALTDYHHAKYKRNTEATGYENKVKELSQFFSSRGNRNATKDNDSTDKNTKTLPKENTES